MVLAAGAWCPDSIAGFLLRGFMVSPFLGARVGSGDGRVTSSFPPEDWKKTKKGGQDDRTWQRRPLPRHIVLGEITLSSLAAALRKLYCPSLLPPAPHAACVCVGVPANCPLRHTPAWPTARSSPGGKRETHSRREGATFRLFLLGPGQPFGAARYAERLFCFPSDDGQRGRNAAAFSWSFTPAIWCER